MNKYNGLLNQISKELHILRGTSEKEDSWEARVVYSVTGRMAYAALHDSTKKEEPVSIVHMKRRIQDILESYLDLYPEIQGFFDADGLENEIYDIFLSTGQMYHTPDHVTPPMPQASLHSGIIFTRGMPLSQEECVSGLGTFLINGRTQPFSLDVKDMFQLQKKSLQTVWEETVSDAKWSRLSSNQRSEFLRMTPPFSYGYWIDRPVLDVTSVCRDGEKGNWIYYLYKTDGSEILVYQLPSSAAEGYNYSIYTNACLASYGVLPQVSYRFDGNLVLLDLHYLLPPPELYFVKLYSWPDSYKDWPNDFHRVLTRKVFDAIKDVLESEGFRFKEE